MYFKTAGITPAAPFFHIVSIIPAKAKKGALLVT